jgi:dihydrolipoamide dehydrogenase
MIETQLCVLGGGPGGYAAAFLAADKGMDVTLVEIEPRLGGTCLLRGCIPSKSLLHATGVAAEAMDLAEWGIAFDQPAIDIDTLRARKDKVVSTLTGGLAQLAKKRNVRVINARGVFVDSTMLHLEDGDPATYSESPRLKFEHCILATGSTPTVPGFLDIGSPRVMTSTGALDLPDVPARLLVIGGGYIGLELGTVYARLGSAVTVVEMLDSLVPAADAALIRPLAKALEQLLADIHLGTKVTAIEETAQALAVTLEGKADGQFEFDCVLVSIGRRPHSRGFGLENTGAEIDTAGFVAHDEQMRTAAGTIFAIGDVAGQPMLAHKASYDATIAVEAILGEPTAWDARAIPAVMFTQPEVAWAGLTEAEAKDKGIDVEVSSYPWAASGRAQSMGATAGVTRLLIDPATERVLGAGIAGTNAGELIAEAALAIELGATAEDIARTVHAHPTLAETTRFAAEAFYGTATEIYRPKKQ